LKRTTVKKYLQEALDINELRVTLENISHDDKREVESYSKEELVSEAEYVLSCYYEGGHMSHDELHSDDDETRKAAESQVRGLKRFIKKYTSRI